MVCCCSDIRAVYADNSGSLRCHSAGVSHIKGFQRVVAYGNWNYRGEYFFHFPSYIKFIPVARFDLYPWLRDNVPELIMDASVIKIFDSSDPENRSFKNFKNAGLFDTDSHRIGDYILEDDMFIRMYEED